MKVTMNKFLIDILYKITSRRFWIWCATTVITAGVLKRDGDHPFITPVVIVWAIVSALYFMGDTVVDAISKAIEKANINVEVGK